MAAAALAAEIYGGRPSALYLLLDAVEGPTPEVRERSRRALACLDPDTPLPTALDDLGRAVGVVLVDGLARNADQADRRRLAGLLQTLIKEAARLADQRRAA
jgi:hypothetical protein